MRISIVLLVILAKALATPQNRQTYAVENLNGPNFKVSKTNSGFSIENYGGSAVDSSRTSGIAFGEQKGLNTGTLNSAANAYQSSSNFVGQSKSESQSSGAKDFVLTSHGSPYLSNERSVILTPGLLDGGISSASARGQPASSFTARVGNTQSNVVSAVGHTSGAAYNNGAVISNLNPVTHSFQSIQSSSSGKANPSVVTSGFGAKYTDRYYDTGSLSSLNNGYRFSTGLQNHGASSQKSGTISGQKSVSSSGVSDSFDSRFLHRGSASSGAYSDGINQGQINGIYGTRSSESISEYDNNPKLSVALANHGSAQTSDAFSGQKSISSGVSDSLDSRFGHQHRTSASSNGFPSGGYSSGIYSGQSEVTQSPYLYGKQQYTASIATSDAGNNPASSFGTRNSFSRTGSDVHSHSDVSKSTHGSAFSSSSGYSEYPSQQYGLKLGNAAQAQKSLSSGSGKIQQDNSGDRFSNTEIIKELNEGARWEASKFGARSGSVASSSSGASSGFQSGSTRQASVREGSSLQNSYILKQTQDLADDGRKFSYSYDTDNGISVRSSGSTKDIGTENESQVMTGSYTYLGDDGQTYTVTYVADENGFQPQGAHLHPIPEEIVRSIEYNAAHPEEITLL